MRTEPTFSARAVSIIWLRRGFRKLLRLFRIKKNIEINSPSAKTLAKAAAPITRYFFSPQLTRIEAELSTGFRFQEVNKIHAEPKIPPHRSDVELHRNVDAVNWMLTYPWVLESGSSVTESLDYYFSDTRSMYEQIAVEVYDMSDHYIGFAVFSASQQGEKTVLKTRDFRFEQPSYERAVLALALRYGREYDAETIELPMEAARYIPGKLQKVLLQPKERIYQCMPKSDDSPLALLWQEINFHLWDGDMAFS